MDLLLNWQLDYANNFEFASRRTEHAYFHFPGSLYLPGSRYDVPLVTPLVVPGLGLLRVDMTQEKKRQETLSLVSCLCFFSVHQVVMLVLFSPLEFCSKFFFNVLMLSSQESVNVLQIEILCSIFNYIPAKFSCWMFKTPFRKCGES